MPSSTETDPQRPLRSRVSRRIFGLFVGCTLVPLFALSLVSYVHISKTLHSSAGRELRQSCKLTGMTVFERLQFLEQDLGLVVSRIESLDARALMDAVSPNLVRIGSRFSGIGLYSESGDLLSSYREAPAFTTLSVQDLYHLEGNKALLRSRESNHPWSDVVLVRSCKTAPLATTDTLYVVAGVMPSHLWGGDGLVSLDVEFLALDDDSDGGEVIFSTNPEVTAAMSYLGSAESGVFAWSDARDEYLASSWQLFMMPQFRAQWKLIYSRGKSEILAPLYRFRVLFLLIGFLSFLIVTLLSVSQVRKRLMSIQELVAATEKVGVQNFDCRVSIDSKDEFEKLGHAFNAMVNRLETDVKVRDHVERELITARDKAVAAAQTEAQFIANVSHELRTPMTSIRAFAEILRDHGAEDQKTHDEFLDIILAESDRLTRLIENVLDLTKIHSMVKPEFEVIDVSQTIRDICVAMSVVAADRGITIEDRGIDGPLWSDGDQDHLKQVWTNLISNATKFSPDDSVVRVTADLNGDTIVVEVTDQGPGISEKDQKVVFERFRQVTSDVVTDKPAGTGLGLTIAKDIVQLHKGVIEVSSQPGEGATFRVILPVSFHTVSSPMGM